MKTISPQALYERQLHGEDIVIIDVRNPDEYDEVHIDGAILQPLPEFDPQETLKHLKEEGLDDHEIYVTCASGKRASTACQLFIEDGTVEVTLIEGGTHAWLEAGLPTEGSVTQ